jgi:hypothetical protein
VTNASIAIDGLKALQIASDIAAQIALHHPFIISDNMEDFIQLLLGKIRGAHVGIKAGGLNDEIGPSGTNAIDIAEGKADFLFGGEFDAEETRHRCFS